MRNALIAAALLLHPFFCIAATAQSYDQLSDRVDALISDQSIRQFSGAVQISKGDEILYRKARGFADVERQIPIKVTDNFRILSNSKQVTAVLVLKQIHEGTIDLHEPIARYWPSLPMRWKEKVTVAATSSLIYSARCIQSRKS